MDFKLDRCLATGTSKCSAKFDVVLMRNAKDIVKYIGHGLKINILTNTQSATLFTSVLNIIVFSKT